MVRYIIIAVALVSGGAAAYLTSQPHNASPAAQASTATSIDTVEILIAKSAIEVGDDLEKSQLSWQAWPTESVSEGLVVRSASEEDADILVGTISKARFQKGEPIRLAQLRGEGTSFMSSSLPSGKRAVAVKISAHSTAGGFIQSEDRVDVIHTETFPAHSGGGVETATSTLLTNVRVLAVEKKAPGKGKDPNVEIVGKTATLEVDPRQAEIIAAAESSGTISLALRAMVDNREKSVSQVPPTIRFIRSGKVETMRVATGSE